MSACSVEAHELLDSVTYENHRFWRLPKDTRHFVYAKCSVPVAFDNSLEVNGTMDALMQGNSRSFVSSRKLNGGIRGSH